MVAIVIKSLPASPTDWDWRDVSGVGEDEISSTDLANTQMATLVEPHTTRLVRQ